MGALRDGTLLLRQEWLAVVFFVAIPTLFELRAPAVVDRLKAAGSTAPA